MLPLLWFHRLMRQQRHDLHREADRLSREAAVAKAAGQDVSEALTRRYAEIDQMPTWPVSWRTGRRFGLGNLYLVVPVLADVFGASSGLQDLFHRLGG